MRTLVFILMLAVSLPAFADPPSEQEKINYLLGVVEHSDGTFMRSGTEYSGKDARDHLQMKLENAGDRVKTAEDFITYIASSSSMTGEPYQIKLRDGTIMETGDWLRHKLADMKTVNP